MYTQAGKTAYDVAVECQHWQVVEMLMEAGSKQVRAITNVWTTVTITNMYGL